MFRATVYLAMETDCALSRVTGRWAEPFRVSQEEVVDDGIIQFVLDGGDHADELASALADTDEIRAVERLDENRLLLTKHSCGALPAIRANHGMLEGWDRVNGDQRVFDIVVFRREDLRAIIADLRELGSVRLGRLTPFQRPETMLSERQSEVVATALEAGYFEWPREADAETVADELGISHSTFLEHLRKAERTLLADALSRGESGVDGPPGERAFMHGIATDGGR